MISYRVVSADGHPVRGGSVFGVGDAAVDTGALGRVAGDSDDRVWEVIGGVGRGLAYAGALVAAGGALFVTVVQLRDGERERARRLVRRAALVGAAAALVSLPIQAALGTGQGPGSLFDDGVLADVAADGVGHALLLCLVGLALVAVGVGRSRPTTVVGALVAAASFAGMGDVAPPVARGERVPGTYDPWKVPIEVDGTATEVQGTLTYEDAVSPLPWAALAVAGGAALAWLGRGRGLRLPAVVLAAVAVAAFVVGRAEWSSTPDSGGNPLLWALPAVAAVAAIGAAVLARRSAGVVLALASVATLSGWALFRVQILVKPVLPTELPFAVDRATLALAFAASAAMAYLAVTSGVLTLPDLDDEPEG